jgi:outer membrane receptor for ferrienterochelin and colicin
VTKLVYDVGPSQQVGMSMLMGMSAADGEDESSPELPGDGTNRVSMLNLSWRSTLRPSLVVTQRAYVVTRDVLNQNAAGQERDRGTDAEIAYRADVTSHVGSGLLEAGVQIGRIATRQATASPSSTTETASSALQSGYVHFAWTATPELTVSPGLRVSHSALLRHTTLTPWILGEWALKRRWTMSASAGLAHQQPQLHHTFGHPGSRDLRPERAASFDAGIEHRATEAVDWQVAVFSRRETDVLREPDLYPRLVDGMMVEPDADRYVNALKGWSRGLEVVVNLRGGRRLSGSAAYSYGKTSYTDVDRGEIFWSDFDQRHAFALAGVYRFSDRTSVGTLLRASNSFPFPAYLSERDGRLFVADHRNHVRLPPYARLDLRAERRFGNGDRRLTLFAEVVNVANRANLGVGNGTVNRATGEAVGFTDRLFRRRASAGILVEF